MRTTRQKVRGWMRNGWKGLALFAMFAAIATVTYADGFVPGSADDPLVTKSYVDERIQAAIAELRGNSQAPIVSPPSPSSGQSSTGSGTGTGGSDLPATLTYQVLALKPGDVLLGGAGMEFIVRTGKAVAIGNAGGNGLPDVTEGTDVKNGQEIKLNHLLLVPSKDGRGIRVTGSDTCHVMVRGPYELKKAGQ